MPAPSARRRRPAVRGAAILGIAALGFAALMTPGA